MAATRRRRTPSQRDRGGRRWRGARSLAKLTRPRPDTAYPRRRLFQVLDGHHRQPVVWIAGPPGAGKTTLAATWLEARRIPGLWYQLDRADSDAATFFYYLKQAAEAACPQGQGALPLFTPEYLGDVAGFARRWFRELFSRLPNRAVLALDNYQELDAGSPLHRAFAEACCEIPEGGQLLVMSWADPPVDLSTLVAREQLAVVDAEALRLTTEEAIGIAAGKDALTVDEIGELQAGCRGWAAGFTLLRERTRRTGLVNRIDQGATMQEVFDYFMAQVFRDAPAAARETLIKTAVLPSFTGAMASEMSGNERAGELLESLCRRHLFIERRFGEEVTYEYHALFRAFLLDQAKRYYTPLGLAELSQRAAQILEQGGSAESAVQLLLESGDGAQAARLVEKLAPGLVTAGRGAALREWIDALPVAERDRHPLLSYWLGAAITDVSFAGARADFERAYEGFVRDADRVGQAMAVSGVLQTYLIELDDLEPIGPWVAMIESLFAEAPAFPTPSIAARVYGTLVGIMLWVFPRHPLLNQCVQRLETVLEAPLADQVKVTAAGQLAEYYLTAGSIRDADRLVAAVEPLAMRPGVSPLAQVFWLVRTSARDYLVGDFQAVRHKANAALAIAVENRLPKGYVLICGRLADVALDLGDLDEVQPLIEKTRRLVRVRVPRHGVSRLQWTEAKLAALTGDLESAKRLCEEACAASSSLPFASVVFRITLASILGQRGELERARAVLDSVRDVYPPERFPLVASRVEALRAVLGPGPAGAPARLALEEAVCRVRHMGVEIPFTGQPLAAVQVAAPLVSAGIEVPYVRSWIRRVNMRSPSAEVPNWPWAVHVRTLGGFSVHVDDEPLAFTRKTPRKPLELLQAIVAFGGKQVRAEALSDALWPEADGAAGEAALRITLSRLRKLLRHDVVIFQDGKISMDDRQCRIDLWSFRTVCRDIEQGGPACAGENAAQLLDLYRGCLLDGERERAWVLPYREDLRSQFDTATATLAAHLVREGRHDQADALRREALQRHRLAAV